MVATTGRWRNRALDRTSVTSKRGSDRRGFATDIGRRSWQSDLHPDAGLESWTSKPVVSTAAFQNPEFYKAQAMRLSTYNKPRVVACAEDLAHHIGLPRGRAMSIRGTSCFRRSLSCWHTQHRGGCQQESERRKQDVPRIDRKSTRLNSSHSQISYAVFCLKK